MSPCERTKIFVLKIIRLLQNSPNVLQQKLLLTTSYASCKYIIQPSLVMVLPFQLSLLVIFSSPVFHSHAFKTKSP